MSEKSIPARGWETSNVSAEARGYIARGWKVHRIPQVEGEPTKGPRGKWGGVAHQPQDFDPTDNIGVELGEVSGWLIDVDLDCGEAIYAGKVFLPRTLKSRRGPHVSHYWYISEGARTKKFVDPFEPDKEKNTILEIRGAGHQTVLPPSIHPSGDSYAWGNDLDPAKIDAGELLHVGRKMATVALIARYLPATGRHDLSLAYAGFMLKHLPADEITEILETAWELRGGDTSDLAGNVKSTARRLERGEPVKGGGELEKFKAGLPRTLADWWGWKSKKPKGSKADRLLQYGRDDAGELFVEQFKQPHALVDGQPLALDSGAYPWLRRLMLDSEGVTCDREALGAAVATLAALAQTGRTRELHVRAARHGDSLYYWLGDGRIAEIDATGWRIVDSAPVLFRKVPNLEELPTPERGGTLDALKRFISFKNERSFRLFAANMATAPIPDIARPIDLATGVQGAGKTTLGRVKKRVLDPTKPETIRPGKDFLLKVGHCHIALMDNESDLPDWLADTCSRLVTGEGDEVRKLYTDDAGVIREYKRALIINGINVPTDKPDFLDRCLPTELERIPKALRRSESELWAELHVERPKLLGAILDALSGAIAGRVPLQETPRLADWAEHAAAVYEYVGWGRNKFLDDFANVEERQLSEVLEGSPVGAAIVKLMEDREEHTATSTELLEELGKVADGLGLNPDNNKQWPKAANKIKRAIKPLVPMLEAHEIRVDLDAWIGRGAESRKGITLKKMTADTSEMTADTADTEGMTADTLGVPAVAETPINGPNEPDSVGLTADTADKIPVASGVPVSRNFEEGSIGDPTDAPFLRSENLPAVSAVTAVRWDERWFEQCTRELRELFKRLPDLRHADVGAIQASYKAHFEHSPTEEMLRELMKHNTSRR